jgi:hypothetical protein
MVAMKTTDTLKDIRDTERCMEEMRAKLFTFASEGWSRARHTTWNARYSQLNDRRMELQRILTAEAVTRAS